MKPVISNFKPVFFIGSYYCQENFKRTFFRGVFRGGGLGGLAPPPGFQEGFWAPTGAEAPSPKYVFKDPPGKISEYSPDISDWHFPSFKLVLQELKDHWSYLFMRYSTQFKLLNLDILPLFRLFCVKIQPY